MRRTRVCRKPHPNRRGRRCESTREIWMWSHPSPSPLVPSLTGIQPPESFPISTTSHGSKQSVSGTRRPPVDEAAEMLLPEINYGHFLFPHALTPFWGNQKLTTNLGSFFKMTNPSSLPLSP